MTIKFDKIPYQVRMLLLSGIAAFTLSGGAEAAPRPMDLHRGSRYRSPAPQAMRSYGHSKKKPDAWDYAKNNFKWTTADVGSTIAGVRVGEAVGNGIGDLADVVVGNVVDFTATGITKAVQGAKDACFRNDEQTGGTQYEEVTVIEESSGPKPMNLKKPKVTTIFVKKEAGR